jgi:hypothetical protein
MAHHLSKMSSVESLMVRAHPLLEKREALGRSQGDTALRFMRVEMDRGLAERGYNWE